MALTDNDFKTRVREYYETHHISFAQLEKQSEVLFHAKVSKEMLKHWSSEDGGWQKPKVEDNAKLRIIADKIFEMIEEADDLTPTSLATLANAYLSFATKAPPEKMDDSRPTLQQIIDVASKNGKLD